MFLVSEAEKKYTHKRVIIMMKRTLRNMASMCDEAWYIFMGTLKLSCAMLFCAFLLVIWPQSGYDEIMLASALAETPQGLLLIAILASALLEDRRG